MQCLRTQRGQGPRLSHTAVTSRAELDPGGGLPPEGFGEEGPRDPAPDGVKHHSGQHGEPPSRRVFLLGLRAMLAGGRRAVLLRAPLAEGGARAWGVRAYRCRKGAAWRGRAGRGQRTGLPSSPQGSVCFCPSLSALPRGQMEGRQHGLGGSGQELGPGAEP